MLKGQWPQGNAWTCHLVLCCPMLCSNMLCCPAKAYASAGYDTIKQCKALQSFMSESNLSAEMASAEQIQLAPRAQLVFFHVLIQA